MKVKILVYPTAEGGFWATVPGIPGCISEGDTLEEVKANITEALEACLGSETNPLPTEEQEQLHEIEV
jgi:predicted RNase H-like HicB family nuclease